MIQKQLIYRQYFTFGLKKTQLILATATHIKSCFTQFLDLFVRSGLDTTEGVLDKTIRTGNEHLYQNPGQNLNYC